MENKKSLEKEYQCSYCKQYGGKHLGFNYDNDEVCSKCGYIDEFGDPVHTHEWSWNNYVPNNRQKRDE